MIVMVTDLERKLMETKASLQDALLRAERATAAEGRALMELRETR